MAYNADAAHRGPCHATSRSFMPDPSLVADYAHAPDARPRTWVVMGYRAGERTQLLALADGLGWPYEIKDLAHQPWDGLPGLFRTRSLAGIRRESAATLQPPWPDLVITAGMRNEPIARWIRQRSGGTTRLVHVGRPWARLEHFDLVVSTPQYRLPDRPNVLQNVGTLHGVNQARLAAAAEQWQPRFAHLPRPWIGVVVGGNSGPYTFGPATARDLGRSVADMAKARGGSLLVTTSARTQPAATDALEGAMDCSHCLYRWAPGDTENPYLAILGLADDLVVTSDSVSMVSEAAATTSPVYLFDLDAPRRARRAGRAPSEDFRLGAVGYRALQAAAPQRLTRDLDLFLARMVESGRCAWLGEEPPQTVPFRDDLPRAVARVRALFYTR